MRFVRRELIPPQQIGHLTQSGMGERRGPHVFVRVFFGGEVVDHSEV